MKKSEKDSIKESNKYIIDCIKRGITPFRGNKDTTNYPSKPPIKKDLKIIKSLYKITSESIENIEEKVNNKNTKD